MQKKFVKENEKYGAELRETFTCNPFFLATLLFILELFREFYIDPVNKLIKSWHLLGWIQFCETEASTATVTLTQV